MVSVLEKDKINKTLHDHDYKALDFIGEGAYGKCLRVYSLKYYQTFVCKVISQVRSFNNEINSLASMSHPNIIKLYDHFTEYNKCFLILEDCENGDIINYLRNNNVSNQELIRICYEIINVIEYIHSQGLCHLDIKPSNIIVDKNGRVKLADFGFSQSFDNLCNCDRIGTRLYRAPEVFEDKPFDPFKADIWSMGITLYYIVFGTFPFHDYKEWINRLTLGVSSLRIPKFICDELNTVLEMSINVRPFMRKPMTEIKDVFSKCPSLANVYSQINHNNSCACGGLRNTFFSKGVTSILPHKNIRVQLSIPILRKK
ncbi:CAMK family protein kinase [Trichomonas vaginalis G3]|uniref:CAMK family protein kinase n=1 Tax=Trichomonas vaginalis (strain ATCC PRA-98 / G3) TaxID=412133 RepID=A2E7C1_TRIV3|nr:3-phosphoinositide-dependent protein kinase protein [Trichomonas vaginalis G3]EAY11414.1 CAMK family protein kinase [Trichomonas vaginalis G3]KAI5498614.1 3-phosphoinositide-dependent protein kinase protein [Trichomonas vaginalis G3]|eukprot:XP_001323637.1 CAMK family protein kinase [Trichomonas vaginalis G3]